ncbi:MAG: hypothetical protein LBE32_00170 [Burkholderiales bacterium]|jgi:hypothetical protein|nr:hypothetical protein [Burkholderiales bacterium]
MKRSLFHILGCAVLALGFSAAAPVWAQVPIVYDGSDPTMLQNVPTLGNDVLAPSGSNTGKSNSLAGNSVTLETGGTVAGIRGAMNSLDADEVSGNHVIIESGVANLLVGVQMMSASIAGGEHYALSSASYGVSSRSNVVSIRGGEVVVNSVITPIVGGLAANYGTGSAAALGNLVGIEGGVIQDNNITATSIIGGSAYVRGDGEDVEASGNAVWISGGEFRSVNEIVGGRAWSNAVAPGTATASNNTVIIDGTPIFTGALPMIYGAVTIPAGGTMVDNILHVSTIGLSVRGLENFQLMDFMLPTALANGDTMITTGAAGADLTGVTISVDIDNPLAPPTIVAGNRYTLISNVSGTFAPVSGTLGGLSYTISIVTSGGSSSLVLDFRMLLAQLLLSLRRLRTQRRTRQ